MGTIADSQCVSTQVDRRDGGLLTFSQAGGHYLRTTFAVEGDRVRREVVATIGPSGLRPQSFPLLLEQSADGGTIAYTLPASGEVAIENPGAVPALRVKAPRTISISLSGDGRLLATKDSVPGEGLQVWDARTGQEVISSRELKAESNMAFAPNGESLALIKIKNGRNRVLLLSTTDWTIRHELDLGAPMTRAVELAWSPDGRFFATVGNRRVNLFRGSTLEPLASWEEPGAVARIAFSPDSRYLALAGDGITIRDLKLVEAQLRAMNLGWDAPAKP